MKPIDWLVIIAIALLLTGGGVIYGESAMLQNQIQRLADAIAFAEGFFVDGSRPQRNNNPGDLTRALGFCTTGFDSIYAIFCTLDDGWNALKKQVELMLTNKSLIYNNQMTIKDVSMRWTTTQQEAWAQNVANRLGVPVLTKISEI